MEEKKLKFRVGLNFPLNTIHILTIGLVQGLWIHGLPQFLPPTRWQLLVFSYLIVVGSGIMWNNNSAQLQMLPVKHCMTMHQHAIDNKIVYRLKLIEKINETYLK